MKVGEGGMRGDKREDLLGAWASMPDGRGNSEGDRVKVFIP